jgi:hypothetical protein
MRISKKIGALVLTSMVLSFACHAQGIVGKLKQKATKVGEKELNKKVQQSTGTNPSGGNTTGNTNQSGGNSNDPTNKGGGGLVVTPPDVNQNLTDADAAYKGGNYSDARDAIRQAMLGVEMEIGQKVLASLPETVSGLNKEAEADEVTSMGYGWVGLTIHREYSAGDKQLTVNIANNSAWMSAVNAYLSGGYAQQTGGQQNWKQTKVKGYKGIIEYSDASGYKLSVPIGQSSLIVWDGINFASEQEMMNAANAFDIDGIKAKLGEK